MGKQLINLFWNKEKNYTKLSLGNQKAICEHNQKMLSALTAIGGLLMLLPILTTPFSRTKASAVPSYMISSILFFTLFFLSNLPSMKKHTLLGLYACFSILFIVSIYLSVVHTPNMRATILLGAFCIMPLGFIDRPARMNIFVCFWFMVHTILSYYLKPKYAGDDALNCLCFAILGCFIGNIMVWVRLEGYETHRLLTIEKETDALSGLYNRRKLFESLALLEGSEVEKPSGILMIDIDNFKEFNDTYGHAAGDKCLSYLGEVFAQFTKDFQLDFYRYGGEEFVIMAYGYNERELTDIAERLRTAVENTDIEGHHTTASIGVTYCGDEVVQNYDNIIDRADKAVYAAKRFGRNNVCFK